MDFTLCPKWEDCGGVATTTKTLPPAHRVHESSGALRVLLERWDVLKHFSGQPTGILGDHPPGLLKCDSNCFVAFIYTCDQSVGTEGWRLAEQPAVRPGAPKRTEQKFKELKRTSKKNEEEPQRHKEKYREPQRTKENLKENIKELKKTAKKNIG